MLLFQFEYCGKIKYFHCSFIVVVCFHFFLKLLLKLINIAVSFTTIFANCCYYLIFHTHTVPFIYKKKNHFPETFQIIGSIPYKKQFKEVELFYATTVIYDMYWKCYTCHVNSYHLWNGMQKAKLRYLMIVEKARNRHLSRELIMKY